MIDMLLLACFSAIFLAFGLYLLIKPKQTVDSHDTNVDSIIGTLILTIIFTCMTSKHLGGLLFIIGLGLTIIFYCVLLDLIGWITL